MGTVVQAGWLRRLKCLVQWAAVKVTFWSEPLSEQMTLVVTALSSLSKLVATGSNMIKTCWCIWFGSQISLVIKTWLRTHSWSSFLGANIPKPDLVLWEARLHNDHTRCGYSELVVEIHLGWKATEMRQTFLVNATSSITISTVPRLHAWHWLVLTPT